MTTPHVLSIQSSVALGHVGNSAAVFPMQYRGVNVSALHTLQYSSHVAYNCGFAGTKIPEADIRAILSKFRTLESDSPQQPLFTHILSGYIGTPEIVQALAEFIKEKKEQHQKNSNNGSPTAAAAPFFFCDPVCGDNGRLYVLQSVAENIRDQLLPLADAIAPNFFEASWLSGIHIEDDKSASAAANKLHDLGPKIVIITSYSVKDEPEDKSSPASDAEKNDPNPHHSHKTHLHCLLSRREIGKDGEEKTLQDVFAFKNVIGQWVGTGDTFAALILSEFATAAASAGGDKKRTTLPEIVKRSIQIMSQLVEDTKANQKVLGGQRELRIIENRALFDLSNVVDTEEGVVQHIIKS